MSRGRFTRGWGALGLGDGDDGLLPDESLHIGTEFIGRLAKCEFEVVRSEGDEVFRHFTIPFVHHHLGFVHLSETCYSSFQKKDAIHRLRL